MKTLDFNSLCGNPWDFLALRRFLRYFFYLFVVFYKEIAGKGRGFNGRKEGKMLCELELTLNLGGKK